MVFSGEQADAKVPHSVSPPVPEQPKTDWASLYDAEQVFRLIDSILPFEACLYHQILPISLEGSRLKLGMVNLEDSAALDYVRRILAYMNCSLVPQTINSDLHHRALSAYLNYTGNQKKPVSLQTSSQSHSVARRIERKLSQESTKTEPSNPDAAIAQSTTEEAPKLEITEKSQRSNARDANSHPTLLVDSPENLNFQDLDITDPQAPPPAIVIGHAVDDSEPEQNNLNGPQSTFILKSEVLPVPSTPEAPPKIPSPGESLPELTLHPRHLSDTVDVLASLAPAVLLQELLARVLLGGIGRLYLERQQNIGRILWSQNGVLQSVIEELPLETFQGVINELKLLTQLPLIPVSKPRQVEIERVYQRHRLLLRLRVMPGNHGEEATVQVLRGAALKFYQQQQLASLSRDALNIAQELQQKVNEIRVRTRFYPVLSADQLSVLPALDNVLTSVGQQLDALKELQPAEEVEEEDQQ